MKTLKQSIITIVICLAVVAGVSLAFATWTNPTANPTANNVDAPINASTTPQIKYGPLQVNGFWNKGDTILDGNVSIGMSKSEAAVLRVVSNNTLGGIAIQGESLGSGHPLRGVSGYISGGGTGYRQEAVLGVADIQFETGTGVAGESGGFNPSGTNIGVLGRAYNAQTNWAGYFDGNTYIKGDTIFGGSLMGPFPTYVNLGEDVSSPGGVANPEDQDTCDGNQKDEYFCAVNDAKTCTDIREIGGMFGFSPKRIKYDITCVSVISDSSKVSIINSNVGIGTIGPAIDLAIGDSDTGLQQQGDGELGIYTNNAERIRIDKDGKIGIGTTPGADLLTVNGTISAGPIIFNDLFMISGGNTGYVGVGEIPVFRLFYKPSSKKLITVRGDNGNVGIGELIGVGGISRPPEAKLEIAGDLKVGGNVTYFTDCSYEERGRIRSCSGTGPIEYYSVCVCKGTYNGTTWDGTWKDIGD